MKLSDNTRVMKAHERFTLHVEMLRKNLSDATNSAHDTTAVMGRIAIVEGYLKELNETVRESYYNG